MLDDSKADPLTLWMARLQRKIDDLEQDADQGKTDRLAKDLGTCDTFLKKLYMRAKDYVFHTPEGPQVVQDLAKIKVRLEKLRARLPRRSLWDNGSLFDPTLWEKLA